MIAEARVTPDNQLQSAVADVVKKYDDVEATCQWRGHYLKR
jgi:hypothetical protein